jgi:hypothetical protein
MPERWLTELWKIDRVEPSHGLLERAEVGPQLPELRPLPMARARVLLVAVLVAAAGSWAAFAALRESADDGMPPVPSLSLTPIPQPGDQRVIGPAVVLARGVVDRTPWKLLAYRSESGLCVDLEIEEGSTGGCGPVPMDREFEVSQGSVLGLDRMIIHGKVSERVASVEVRPLDGGPIATEIISDPAGLGVSFFVQFVPRDTLGEIVALDAAGNLLQSVRLRPLESEESAHLPAASASSSG